MQIRAIAFLLPLLFLFIPSIFADTPALRSDGIKDSNIKDTEIINIGRKEPSRRGMIGATDKASLDYAKAVYEGAKYSRNGEYEKAIEKLEEAIKINPNKTTAYNSLAFTYIQIADTHMRRFNAKPFSRLTKKDFEGFEEDKVFFNVNKAIEMAKKTLVIDPENSFAYAYLSNCYGKMTTLYRFRKDHTEALKYFKMAKLYEKRWRELFIEKINKQRKKMPNYVPYVQPPRASPLPDNKELTAKADAVIIGEVIEVKTVGTKIIELDAGNITVTAAVITFKIDRVIKGDFQEPAIGIEIDYMQPRNVIDEVLPYGEFYVGHKGKVYLTKLENGRYKLLYRMIFDWPSALES